MAASRIPIVRMHGTHNEFVLVDERTTAVSDLAALARLACDRGGELGADGLLVIGSSARADARMRILNADGSEAEMCGNGIRCAVRYLVEDGAAERLAIETAAGTIECAVVAKEPEFVVRVNVGRPSFSGNDLGYARAGELVDAVLGVDGMPIRFSGVSLGNPHVVVFVDDVDSVELETFGPRLAAHPAFANGTNVHVAASVDRRTLRVRHWERGVGATQACGTGAVAVAAAAIRRGLGESPVRLLVPGGILDVNWDGEGDAFLTGSAVRVEDRSIAPPA